MTLKDIEKVILQKTTEKDYIDKSIKVNHLKIYDLEEEAERMVKARWVISEASRITQEQFKILVEELVTSAIQSVFENQDYKFIVDFSLQNNRPQINLLVQDGDKDPYIPRDEQGGGLMDIIGFALKVVMWSLQSPKNRNVLILDEPFRWTGNYTQQAGMMMKEISKKLGLQIIMVTHDERLMDIADRSWLCKREKDISIVREVQTTNILTKEKQDGKRKGKKEGRDFN